MAGIWRRQAAGESGSGGVWMRAALGGAELRLPGARLVATAPGGIDDARHAPERWLLLADARARVNGEPVVAGVRLLRDRDEIRLAGGEVVWFSSEELARIEPFPGNEPLPCARSCRPITPGAPSVRCPRCGTWHLQTEEYPGWTYAGTCTVCSAPTRLSGDYAWHPGLEDDHVAVAD